MSLKSKILTTWSHLRDSLSVRGHRIRSGKYPLYRLIVFGVLVGSVVQALFGPSPAIVSQFDVTLTDIYISGQFVGSVFILVSIQFMKDTPTAARVERFGLVWLALAIAVYVASVCLNNEGLPESTATYVLASIGIYFVYRIRETNNNLKEYKKRAIDTKPGDYRE